MTQGTGPGQALLRNFAPLGNRTVLGFRRIVMWEVTALTRNSFFRIIEVNRRAGWVLTAHLAYTNK